MWPRLVKKHLCVPNDLTDVLRGKQDHYISRLYDSHVGTNINLNLCMDIASRSWRPRLTVMVLVNNHGQIKSLIPKLGLV